MDKKITREVRIDERPQADQTTGMDMTEKIISELLAKARDITKATLGTAPDAIVAEVFRHLSLEHEYSQMNAQETTSDTDDDYPAVLH